MESSVFKNRRDLFMSKIKKGVAIFPSAKPCKHKFRQDSNFYYLTGFKEPGAVLLLAPEHPEHKYVLFVRPRDRAQEIWTGKRAGVEGAKEIYGADESYPINELDSNLPKYLDGVENIYYTLGSDEVLDEKILNILKQLRGKRYDTCSGPVAIIDPQEIVRNMRAIKDKHEIELIQKAAEISCMAHIEAMKQTKPGMYEYQVQAIIEYNFLKNGAMSPAYPTIVASGPNALCLHYDANDCLIEDGHLLLIDAGAEYQYYASDITRTFPANGKFSEVQKALYNIVLNAQLSAIEEIKPGVSIERYHERAIEVIVDGLLDIGLLRGEKEKIIQDKVYEKFYMHSSGHWLGLDVHDVGQRKFNEQPRPFEPGMIVTVEPGIYVSSDIEDVDDKYKGIGIRIEDDVLVTETGNMVLTSKVPKTIEEIEELMAHRLGT